MDFNGAGGVPQVLMMLLVHGCSTATVSRSGQRPCRRIENVPAKQPADQDVIRQWTRLYPHGQGNTEGHLAPEGCVAKITGLKSPGSRAARVFYPKRCRKAIMRRRQAGDVVVIRTKARNTARHAEMLAPTGALVGQGLG